MISIIIPVYNESLLIEKTLQQLSTLKTEAEFEIIVSDGKSTDNTVELARPYCSVVCAEKGKAKQMNAAAEIAKGDILFFVHADMFVPAEALNVITRRIYCDDFDGGGFANAYSSHNKKIKRISRLLSLLLTNNSKRNINIFYGDNGIFIKKSGV